ncbi:MAG: methylenetetrahydrofolate reductase [Clostridia bacterium]|nr:methylenetetrahydrofolate reductase [Clostridia bacterium]
MKIIELLNSGKVTVSCELFPPKTGEQLENAKEIVRQTAALSPAFISVTCGAGGTNAGLTVELADIAQNECGVPALVHSTCVTASADDIAHRLSLMKQHNLQNVLALRGDIPEGVTLSPDFVHASDLTAEILKHGDFCVGGACYPDKHPESVSVAADIEGLKRKLEAGCQFLTTQMFFDNQVLYRFLLELLRAGLDVPVCAGIMPVTNARQIVRSCALSGTLLPPRFKAIVDRFGDNPAAMRQAGIAYATDQIIDLIANGVTHIHLYTMNRPEIAGEILRNLSDIVNV